MSGQVQLIESTTSLVQPFPTINNIQPVKTNFRTAQIDRQSPNSFVWTNPIIRKHKTSTVQAIPTNKLRVKTIFTTIPKDRKSPEIIVWVNSINWKRPTSIIQAIPIKRQSC